MRKKVHFLFLFVLANLVFLGANAQLLLQEGFEGTFPPSGWTLTNNGSGNSWTQNTTATYVFAGTKSMQYLFNATNAADAWAFTPALTLTTTPVLITFYLRVRSATFPESFKLTIGNDTIVANHTNILMDSTSIKNTVFQKWEVTYTPSAAGTYYLGFNVYSTANQWNVYVDNLTVQTLSACTGKPNAGIATGPSAVCSGQTINISDSGATFGTGISYQWQNSIDNGATWTDIIGATTSSYSSSLSDTTSFRFVTTCSNSGDTAISNVVKVGLKGVLVCAFCSPNNGINLHSATGPTIQSVSISGTTLNNANSGTPTNGYTQFPASGSTTAELTQSLTYDLITNFSGSTIVSVWFDWNQDGVYDASEWTQITTTGAGPFTTPIQVPSNASLGVTGMRVRSRGTGSPNGSTNACTTFASGETEEYLINVVAGTPCTGTPIGGVAFGPASVCSGTNFTIKDSGATASVGVIYQWQTSTDNGATWSDVTGATSATYTGAISDTTWFRYKATCTNSSTDGYSNSIKVGLNGTLVCAYCSPNNGTTLHSGIAGPVIQTVSITGTTLSNVSATSPIGGYTQFPASGNTTATLTQALTYDLVTTLSATGKAFVWFDWNQDGVYDASESTQITASGTGAITTSISIPANATLGQIGMRIRTNYTFNVNGPAAACSTFTAGETEEYLVTIAAGVACTGTPIGGIASGPSSICSGIAFNISDSAFTTATGITYQWQSSLDNGATWTDITGATSAKYSATITDTTWFRFKVTCTNSSLDGYSNVIKVGLNATLICAYCSPNNGTTLHSATSPTIQSVSISGTTLNNANPGTPTNGYTQFPAGGSTTAELTQSLTYNLITSFSGSTIVSVWFDWNQDGVYDASEWTQITTTGAGPFTTAIQVPSNSSLGLTGMRLRSRGTGSPNGSTNACTTFASGETEEYLINIVAGTPCTGAPIGGVASGPSSVCSGTNFTIKDSGATTAVGVTYQWQSSIDNGANWTDVTGATSASYTSAISDTTWFRYKATCTNSSLDGYSNTIKVGLNGTLVCAYCSPNNGTTLHSGIAGPVIQAVSITGTTLSNASATSPAGGYTQFPASGNTTATLSQALTYNLVTTLSAIGKAFVWFDWNQDGVYDASEATQITASGTGAITTSIAIPANATLGQIGMRIRSNYTFNVNGPASACSTFTAGETEEYLVTITAGVACTGTPTGGYASTSKAYVCSGTNVNLSDSGATAASGITYQWQSSLDNGATWTDVTGATSASYIATITDTTWFRFKVTCTSSSLDGYSNVIKVGLNAALLCAYCGPNNGVTLHGATSPTLDSVSITGTTLANKNVGAPTGGYTQFSSGANTTAVLAQGSTYNLVTKVSGTTIASLWIDYDQSGTYDSSEWKQIVTTGTGVITTSITIPSNATLGTTGLRIRLRGAGSANGPKDPCAQFFSGETEEYFVTIDAPLPVKLASFTGTHKTIGNVLSWTTLGEQNNTGFKVERSFDGKNFNVVGFVKTSALNGNSSEAINYQFTDEKPFNNSYYRLKQVDKDGKESYSKVVLVKMLNSSELSLMSLYPNPAKNIINLVISGNVDEKVKLVVTDFAGKIVKTQNATLSNSSNIITLDIATLTSGNYLLKVIGKEGTNSAFGKFFKQ